MDPDIPYLLLTPGPLTTSSTVRQAMQRDYCTWDADYNQLVSDIRQRVVRLVTESQDFTCVLMQGSGTFSVEATLGSIIPPDGKLLVISNGAYGRRIAEIGRRLRIDVHELACEETEAPDAERVAKVLHSNPWISHVAMVHCETTTGMLNPVEDVGRRVRQAGRIFIVDAMSSLGGIPLSMEALQADYLISSANKCLQGTPGFGLVIARRADLGRTEGWARSLSLDLLDQWREMESGHGKWRYTSPTHVVRAFHQAVLELDQEGGVPARHRRYRENQWILSQGMTRLGLPPLLPAALQSPIITAFAYPAAGFDFSAFYLALKRRRFVIYPGKVTGADTFRIGSIGHVFPQDMRELLTAVGESLDELGLRLSGTGRATPQPGA